MIIQIQIFKETDWSAHYWKYEQHKNITRNNYSWSLFFFFFSFIILWQEEWFKRNNLDWRRREQTQVWRHLREKKLQPYLQTLGGEVDLFSTYKEGVTLHREVLFHCFYTTIFLSVIRVPRSCFRNKFNHKRSKVEYIKLCGNTLSGHWGGNARCNQDVSNDCGVSQGIREYTHHIVEQFWFMANVFTTNTQ